MNRRMFFASAGAAGTALSLEADPSAWESKLNPLIVSNLTSKAAVALRDYTANGRIVASDVLLLASAWQLWSAHIQQIGALPDVALALAGSFHQPLSSTALETFRQQVYQVATG